MNPINIFYPTIGMVSLTSLVLSTCGVLRIGGLVIGKLNPDYYLLFREQDDAEPNLIRAFSRNYKNLLQLPILLYAGCITAYVTGLVTDNLIVLAWIYFGCRCLHTLIHVTYNQLWYRAATFISSCFVLFAYWVVLAAEISQSRPL